MKNETTTPKQAPVQTHCPICNSDANETDPHFPFCTKRCQTIDLGRWADGSYKITRPIEQRDLEEGVD